MGETEGSSNANGGAGDSQRLKRIAAAAYDYENDARWAEYWSNVLVPPHLAARPGVVDHFKRKFYQRYIDPDLVVEPMSNTNSSQSAKPSSTSSNDSARPRESSGSSARPSAAAAPPPPQGRGTNSLRLDGRSIHFAINAWVLVVGAFGILPLLPQLASKGYRLSLLGTVFSSAYGLYITYGKPRAWNMPALQTWLQSIVGAKDFLHLMFALMFLTSKMQLKLALVPVLCWAVDHVARFLRKNFARSSLYRKYLDEPCLWVESNSTTINMLGSNAEIALGFLLIVSLFSLQRNIVQAFMYWNLLKLMYQAPVTAGYHQSVWARIGRTVNPYIYRYAPFLGTPISAIRRWWFR